MDSRPDVRYTRSGGAQIAYQVLGNGPVDLVYLPPWGNVVWNWEWPPYAHFLRRLASFWRLIVIDRRGFGCSSGTPQAASLEDDVDDLLAVIEDAQGPGAMTRGTPAGGRATGGVAARRTAPGRRA